MGAFLWHLFSFSSLLTLAIYHLVSSSRSHLTSLPNHHSARLIYPLPHRRHLLRHLPIYLALPSLLLAAVLPPLLSPPPLILPFLRLSVALLLFTPLLLPLPLPHNVPFLLLSLPFFLLSRPPPFSEDLHLHADLSSTAAVISSASGVLALALAVNPRLFAAEFALAASLALRALWSLQSGLSLYVDAFVPDGCHRLLDVPEELSTRCELASSRLRATELLDLAFAIHVAITAAMAVAVYAATARACGGGCRRVGSYEALPMCSSAGSPGEMAVDHVQMKALGKSSAQA